jgi:hypothetical protein
LEWAEVIGNVVRHGAEFPLEDANSL